MRTAKVKVAQDPDEPVERLVLATSIKAIAFHMERLVKTGLNEKAIVCLVHEMSGVGKPDIRAVLNALKGMEKEYCK